MNTEIIFQAEFNIPLLLFVYPIIFILIGLLFGIVKKRKCVSNPRIYRVLQPIVIVVGFITLMLSLSRIIVNYEEVMVPYQNGDYSVVTGCISDLNLASNVGSDIDRFEVEGIVFEVGNPFYAGLQERAIDGGPINKQGSCYFIKYITYDGCNYIVELHEIKDEN